MRVVDISYTTGATEEHEASKVSFLGITQGTLRSGNYLFFGGTLCYLGGLAASLHEGAHNDSSFLWLFISVRIVSLILLISLASKQRSLTIWIFWAMLAGLEVGVDAPRFALHLRIFSDIFLRLIEMIVAPLVFGVLVTGIGKHTSSGEIGRLALKSLVYFEALTTLALVIGLVIINVSKAGSSLASIYSVASSVPVTQSQQLPTWAGYLLDAVPENLAKSVAENHVLQVVVFAILFGVAVGRLRDDQKRPLLAFFDSFTAAVFQLTNLIMYIAPFAVGGALAYAVAHSGFGIMFGLGKLVVALYAAIVVFVLLGMLPVALAARIPVRRFLAAISEPAAIAFATSTSEAALPVAMERMEQLGVPGKIVGFVIPAGYSFNLAGSCLYLSLAAVFMAQAGGMHLSFFSQVMMLWTMMLTSKGIAGIPRAVFVVLTATAASFHLPVGILPILLGVDVLMDMGRTTVNVVGNCLASAVIARWEGTRFALPATYAHK